MENNGFERFSKAWKLSGLAGSTEKLYAEEDIKLFKMKKSKDFSRALNNSIIFDFVFKTILIAGLLLLAWFYRTDVVLVWAIAALIGISVYLLFRENEVRKEFQNIDDYTRELGATIKQKLGFFQTYFPSLRWMLAFTNALFVWVGSMFYFYAKYGFYRIEDVIDILVNVLMVGLAFMISFLALNYQYKFNIRELEENLADLDDQAEAAIHIRSQKKRKMQLMIGITIALVLGLLLFVYLLIAI